MPRKKKNPLDGFELELTEEEGRELRAAITDKLRNSPPAFFELAATMPDQKFEVRKWREFYLRVEAIIDSYWEGAKPPDFSAEGKWQNEYTWIEAFLFLSFYKMVAANWEVIVPFYKRFGGTLASFPHREVYVLDPSKLSGQDLEAMRQEQPLSGQAVKSSVKVVHKRLDEIDGPIDAATEFIQYRVVEHINRAFIPHFKQTPYEVRKRLMLKKKLSNANTKEKTRLQMQTDILCGTITSHPYRAFEVVTLSLTKENAKTKLTKTSINDYLDAKSRLDSFMGKTTHKRHRSERSEWKGGFRKKGA